MDREATVCSNIEYTSDQPLTVPLLSHHEGQGSSKNYLYSDEQVWETNEVGELLCCSTPPSASTKLHAVLDVLLPNGFLIPMQCPTSRTLAQLKMDVFIQARRWEFDIFWAD